MKTTRLTQIRTLAAVVLTASILPMTLFGASILGSKHDLKALTNAGGQICIACHTPHNAFSPQLAPLWNHASTAATFTLYASSSLNAVQGQPANQSKACLSCHDGTVAIDSFGGKTPVVGAGGGGFISGSALIGTNLSNDHPVSFTYDAALASADGGLVSPATASLVGTLPLFAAKMECASCHDPHDNQHTYFLQKSNAASALCLTCHIK